MAKIKKLENEKIVKVSGGKYHGLYHYYPGDRKRGHVSIVEQ